MKISLTFLLFLLTFSVSAENLFSIKTGLLRTTIQSNPENNFKHSVTTYIPKSLMGADLTKAPVMFFLHGGSALNRAYHQNLQIQDGFFINCDRELDARCSINYGSDQVKNYQKEMLVFSEAYKVIMVMPGSNIGWNADSVPLFTNLKKLIQNELNSSGQNFYFSGHSMGAMGTIRLAAFLREHFRAFIALSGTLNDNQSQESFVRQMLGVPLYIVNEEDPSFPYFLTQSARLKDYMDLLVLKYKVPNLTHILIGHGNHNTVIKELGPAFERAQNDPPAAFVADSILANIHQTSVQEYWPTIIFPKISVRVGNATCGEFKGTEKENFDIFHPTKIMRIKIKAEVEGLLNISTGLIERNFSPRSTHVELMTFTDSTSFKFVRDLPKTLKALTLKDGPMICALTVFEEKTIEHLRTKNVLLTAGKSVEEARQKMLLLYRDALLSQ